MKKPLQERAVRLAFGAGGHVHRNLSGAAFADADFLFVVGDEACSLTRLRRTGARSFGEPIEFLLHELLDLPGGADEEADIEGLAFHDGWLWLVGSHGWKRRNPKPDRSADDNARRLAKLRLDGNRRLLACLPVEPDAQGRPRPVRKAADGRRAARLPGDAKANLLTQLLADDPHYAPFLGIPGKDNGFDIEGLAVDGDRVLLGLRGPVLRGWAGLLELRLQRKGEQLRLRPLREGGALLHKHFVSLEGLGVRDLLWQGEDLLLLAGPTMVLDGAIRCYRWTGAREHMAANDAAQRFETTAVQPWVDLPHGRGCDRAEAITPMPDGQALLVLYDAPSAQRSPADGCVYGDLLKTGS